MALSSGCSFGFFMGIGAIMRSGEMKSGGEGTDYQVRSLDTKTGEIKYTPMFKPEDEEQNNK